MVIGNLCAGCVSEQRIHGVLPVAEICALDTVEGFRKIEKTMLRGEAEDTQGAGDGETFAPGGEYAVPIVHQEQISVEFGGKRDGIFFAWVEVSQRSIWVGICGCAHLHPRWGIGNPEANQRRRIVQLVAHYRRQNDLFKEGWKDVDVPDQD